MRINVFDDFRQDVRYALKSFARTPGFTLVVIVTLALGIGANTAIFSVVNAVLLKPLPYRDSDRTFRLLANFPAAESPTRAPLRAGVTLSLAELRDVQSRARTVTDIALQSGVIMGLSGAEDGARLQGHRVSSSVFRMLGARAFVGRVFEASDEAPGGDAIVLLSHAMWQQFLGSDPDVLGRRLVFNTALGPRRQRSYTVVGVMPPEFSFPDADARFWMPFADAAPAGPPPRGSVLVRTADRVTPEAAMADLEPIVRGVRGHAPRITYELRRYRDDLAAPVRPALLMLTVAVGCVLLIACINVANLLLARAGGRQREMTVRAALGASRRRIVRQLLTESLLLSLAGGFAGVFVAWGGVRLLAVLATTDTRMDLGIGRAFPRLDEIGLDGRALGFTIGVSLFSGLLFGLAPALWYARGERLKGLRENAATAYSASGSLRTNRGRGALIVAEIAMAMMLLVGAGLLIRSFVGLIGVEPGFNAANVLTFQVNVPVDAYPDARLRTFAESLVSRLRDVPEVEAAAYANQLPMVALQDSAGGLFKTPDAARKPPQPGPDARLVSRDYLRAMEIRLISGRAFEDRDGAGQPRVILVNQALARRFYPGENPVGRSAYIGADVVPWEIVGVVDNVRQMALDREPEPQFFADFRQWQATGVLFPIGAYYVVRKIGRAHV